jgi:hypothetical protein
MSDVFKAIEEYARSEEAQLRPMIEPVCDLYGYGRIMQLVSKWWREKDPLGAISLGPCYGTLEREKKKRSRRSLSGKKRR